MTKNTETLDKLYLEWSQFTKAETAKEIALKKIIEGFLTWSEEPDPGSKSSRQQQLCEVWESARSLMATE